MSSRVPITEPAFSISSDGSPSTDDRLGPFNNNNKLIEDAQYLAANTEDLSFIKKETALSPQIHSGI